MGSGTGAEDPRWEVFGETVILRQDPGRPGLDASVIEEIVPAGVAAPLHRHEREDEVCYVVEGRFRIWRGEEVFDLGPGGVALLPRGEAHSFACVGEGEGRIVTVITPGGLEGFFREVAEQGLGEEDMEEVMAVAARYGVEILGEPPL